jgi:hypothetical protein
MEINCSVFAHGVTGADTTCIHCALGDFHIFSSGEGDGKGEEEESEQKSLRERIQLRNTPSSSPDNVSDTYYTV